MFLKVSVRTTNVQGLTSCDRIRWRISEYFFNVFFLGKVLQYLIQGVGDTCTNYGVQLLKSCSWEMGAQTIDIKWVGKHISDFQTVPTIVLRTSKDAKRCSMRRYICWRRNLSRKTLPLKSFRHTTLTFQPTRQDFLSFPTEFQRFCIGWHIIQLGNAVILWCICFHYNCGIFVRILICGQQQ